MLVGSDGDFARALCSGRNESVGVAVAEIFKDQKKIGVRAGVGRTENRKGVGLWKALN